MTEQKTYCNYEKYSKREERNKKMKKISFTTRVIIFLLGIAILGWIGSYIIDAAIYISVASILGVLVVVGYKLYTVLFSSK